MNLIPIQTSDLSVGQPLPWDLFDQAHQPIQKRGYIIKTADELKKLEGTSVFRMQKPEPEPMESGKNKFDRMDFEDMRLKVGHKMQLTLSTYSKNHNESSNYSYTASLIGYVQDSTLIVTMPASDQLVGEPFIEGDQIQICLFSGQCVFRFAVFVDKIIKIPFKYLHLSFPKDIQGQNIRKSRRIKCNIQASVVEKSIPLAITDLSIYGAGISSDLPLGRLGSTITLSFIIKILDEEIPLSIKSIIRSAKQINKNNQKIINSGVEFSDMKSEQALALRHLIYQEIVEHPEYLV